MNSYLTELLIIVAALIGYQITGDYETFTTLLLVIIAIELASLDSRLNS